MPKNLDEKLGLILEDCEDLPKGEAIRKIKNLVEDELKFLEVEHTITNYDLCRLRSLAINNYNELPMGRFETRDYISKEYTSEWCKLNAVIALLKSKGLVNFSLKYSKK